MKISDSSELSACSLTEMEYEQLEFRLAKEAGTGRIKRESKLRDAKLRV